MNNHSRHPQKRSTITIPYNKKTRKPLCLLRFKDLPFFSIKTDNALILYKFIPFIHVVSFVMTDRGVKTNIIYLQMCKNYEKRPS